MLQDSRFYQQILWGTERARVWQVLINRGLLHLSSRSRSVLSLEVNSSNSSSSMAKGWNFWILATHPSIFITKAIVLKLVSTILSLPDHLFVYLEVNKEHETVPQILNHLLDKPDTISDLDFLKEDMYSSPRFMKDPSKFKPFYLDETP